MLTQGRATFVVATLGCRTRPRWGRHWVANRRKGWQNGGVGRSLIPMGIETVRIGVVLRRGRSEQQDWIAIWGFGGEGRGN